MTENQLPNPDSGEGQHQSAALAVGKISHADGLWLALRSIALAPAVQHAVLIVFSPEKRGRIGIYCNRLITGAIIDGAAQTGAEAVRQLLSVRKGMFGFRAFLGTEGEELRQNLSFDINQMMAERAKLAAESTPAAALSAGLTITPNQDQLNHLGTQRTKPQLEYIDWSVSTATKSFPAISQTSGPVLPVISSAETQMEESRLSTYQPLLEAEMEKVHKRLQAPKYQQPAGANEKQHREDLELLKAMLETEHRRVKDWSSSTLKAYREKP